MLRPNSLLPDTETSDPEQLFQLLDTLGQGAYGCVSLALHKQTNQLYAIKILSATSMAELDSIKKQIQILKLCDNPHIVKYYGSYLKDTTLWIVLQYCHAGSIIDLLNITQRQLNEHEIASILESILRGLVYLHENKKIHRDIKAANILLNKEGVAKLADFGVSAESMYTNAGHKSQVGSPYWMSPEVMKHNEYTNKTDVWSLGVTAIQLAQGVVPNSHLKPLIAMWQLKDKPIQQLKEPHKWSSAFNNFVRDCLKINPMMRPEAKTLLNHQFILAKSKGQSLLAELVQKSLADIEQFRLGQEHSLDSEAALMNILNDSPTKLQARTIIQHSTNRSKDSRCPPNPDCCEDSQVNLQSSMIINQNSVNGSMIINEQDTSVFINNHPAQQQQSNFLNNYIHGLKHNDNQIEQQRELMKSQVKQYDLVCLQELQSVFQKYKNIINQLLIDGSHQQFQGMDPQYIRSQFQTELLKIDNLKDFLASFPRYRDKTTLKQFERSNKHKKQPQGSQIAHRSTQTTQTLTPSELYPRGVKSQQFNDRQFKTCEKHFFNSNSIISDIQNVKNKHQKYDTQPLNRRFINTQPHEWISIERKHLIYDHDPQTDKHKLKEQFLLDPDVKQSLINHRHTNQLAQTHTVKPDFILENTLDAYEDTIKHQNSITLPRNKELYKNQYSQQEYLLMNREFDTEEEININLFNLKATCSKHSKNEDPKKKHSKNGKRTGTSSEKRSLHNKPTKPKPTNK